MALFDETFTFDATRSPSLDSNNTTSTRDTSRSVSPCSPITAYPPPRFSVTDLAAQFAGSRIRQVAQICYDPCDAYANLDDDAGWSLDQPSIIAPSTESDAGIALASTTSRTHPGRMSRPHSPSRRTHRMNSTRLMCSSAHAQEIATLVARMVESNDQCSIVPCDSPQNPAEADDDEDDGYDSSEIANGSASSRRQSLSLVKSRLDYRRSADMKTTGACVRKTARVRRVKRTTEGSSKAGLGIMS